MNRKRLVAGIGLFAAAIVPMIGVRHCLRMKREHGGGGRRRLSEACRPADCMRREDLIRADKTAALAA